MVRCFVGIMVPEHIRQEAVALQKRLAASGITCRLVEPENMHICLSFLGEVEEGKVAELCSKLDAVALRYKKFDINIGRVKFVPSENYIRVIVLEANDARMELERLREDIVKAVDGDSKPPHLTLCRVKNVEDKKKLVSEFAEVACAGSFLVDSVQLIKSELRRSGPVYSVVHKSLFAD